MMHILQSLRDFLDEEQMKWLPGNLQVETCILLRQNKKDAKEIHRVVVQVFDSGGTWIGEISNPDFIPNNKK